MEITSEIYKVGGEGHTSSQDAAVYLIKLKGHAALVDSGCGFSADRIIDNIRSIGVELKQINLLLITHCHFDHCGGAKILKEKIGCRTIAHQLDAEAMETGDDITSAATWYNASLTPFKIDRKLTKPIESINLGGREIKAIHIPGHSPGSVAYVLESDGKTVLFGQDVHGPLHPSLKSNESDYKTSLTKLLGLKADILCEGHFGVIEGKKPVLDFIGSYL